MRPLVLVGGGRPVLRRGSPSSLHVGGVQHRRRASRSRRRRRARRPGSASCDSQLVRCAAAAASRRRCVSAMPSFASSISSCVWLNCSSRIEMRVPFAAIFAWSSAASACFWASSSWGDGAAVVDPRRHNVVETTSGEEERLRGRAAGRARRGGSSCGMAGQRYRPAPRRRIGATGRADPVALRKRSASPGRAEDRCVPVTTGEVQCWCLGHVIGHFLPLGRAPALRRGHERRVLTQVDERRQPLEAEALDERVVGVARTRATGRRASPRIRRAIAAVLGTHTTVRTSLSPNVAKIRSITGTNAWPSGRSGSTIDREVEHRRPVVERAGHAGEARDRELRIGVLRHGRKPSRHV